MLLNTTCICNYAVFKSSDPTSKCHFPLAFNVADCNPITSTFAADSVHMENEILIEGKLRFFTLLIVTWQFNCEHDPFNLHGTFNLLFKHSAYRAFIRQDEHNTVLLTFLFHFWLDLVSANIMVWLHLDLSFQKPALLALA